MIPRILINMHYMALGGAERALLGLLGALDPERVQIDLFLNQHTGEFMPLIPKYVRLLPEMRGYNAIERPIITVLREHQWGVAFARLRAKWLLARYHRSLPPEQRAVDSSGFQTVADCVDRYLPPINPVEGYNMKDGRGDQIMQKHDELESAQYDLAISFLQPHNIVLNKVRARKKVAWVHTDYSTVHVNAAKELPIWAAYDHIISISPDCTRAFLQAFPTLGDKIIEIENILSPSFVRQQAEAQLPQSDSISDAGEQTVTLLSIGRFSYQKNFENIPDIARRIVDAGCKGLRWWIIGFGEGEGLIRQRIVECGMERHVKILGKKNNPYPYIKACDIYVQPSRYEGKSVTVREAQILCKPVVITNYPTAPSQIRDGVDGVICEMDNASVAHAVNYLLSDIQLQESLQDHLAANDYGNEYEVSKIYALF